MSILEVGNICVDRTRHGVMVYPTNDMYIGRSLATYGEYSAGESDLFNQLLAHDAHVIDVGANIGVHTIFFARKCSQGWVYAFEPQRRVFQILCANIAINDLPNVSAFNAGVASQSGSVKMPDVDISRVGNFGSVPLQGWEQGHVTSVFALDDAGIGKCDFIKIDVEGMELETLRGAKNLISRSRPLLYVENDREQHAAALVEFVLAQGYRIWWHTPPLFHEKNFKRQEKNIFENIASVNILCIPIEKKSSIEGLVEINSPDCAWPFPQSHF